MVTRTWSPVRTRSYTKLAHGGRQQSHSQAGGLFNASREIDPGPGVAHNRGIVLPDFLITSIAMPPTGACASTFDQAARDPRRFAQRTLFVQRGLGTPDFWRWEAS